MTQQPESKQPTKLDQRRPNNKDAEEEEEKRRNREKKKKKRRKKGEKAKEGVQPIRSRTLVQRETDDIKNAEAEKQESRKAEEQSPLVDV